jgi:hypothetical protein
VLKSAPIGFSTVLTATVGYHVVEDRFPVLVLLPARRSTSCGCRAAGRYREQ